MRPVTGEMGRHLLDLAADPLIDLALRLLAGLARSGGSVTTLVLVDVDPDPRGERGVRVLSAEALRILRCSTNDTGHRCERRLCPRCQARASKKLRRSLDDLLLDAHRRGAQMVMLRFSAPSQTIEEGYRGLTRSLAKLRRRASMGAVAGGAIHVEVEPSLEGGLAFNVHAHVAAELHPGGRLSGDALDADWCALLAARDLVGSVHVQPISDAWAGTTPARRGPVSYYLAKRPRAAWLALGAGTLLRLSQGLPGKRLAATFGSWRGVRGAGAREAARRHRKALRAPSSGSDGEEG